MLCGSRSTTRPNLLYGRRKRAVESTNLNVQTAPPSPPCTFDNPSSTTTITTPHVQSTAGILKTCPCVCVFVQQLPCSLISFAGLLLPLLRRCLLLAVLFDLLHDRVELFFREHLPIVTPGWCGCEWDRQALVQRGVKKELVLRIVPRAHI